MTREEAYEMMSQYEYIMFNYSYGTVAGREIIDKIFDEHGEHLMDRDDEIELLKHRVEEAMKSKTCQECKWWDRTRPRSHPNYAECNNRNCPISYEEVIYTFGCNMYEPKDNA